MKSHEGLGLAQALVTLTVAGDHPTASALAAEYMSEYDPAEMLVWMARYAGMVLDLLARADAKGRSPMELAEVLAALIASLPVESAGPEEAGGPPSSPGHDRADPEAEM